MMPPLPVRAPGAALRQRSAQGDAAMKILQWILGGVIALAALLAQGSMAGLANLKALAEKS